MLRNVKSIICGYGWCIRFRGIIRSNNKLSDPILITYVCEAYSNMCDPSYVDPFILVRTLTGVCKHCADQCLKEIVVQMDIDRFLNIRTTIELLQRVFSDRDIIDRHMINNVRIHTRKKSLELDYANIDLDSKYVDTTNITSYQYT